MSVKPQPGCREVFTFPENPAAGALWQPKFSVARERKGVKLRPTTIIRRP
jgi:hypothetical protein